MVEQSNTKTPISAPLCANNCGFYGNPGNNNLCSKCFKECPNLSSNITSENANDIAAENGHLKNVEGVKVDVAKEIAPEKTEKEVAKMSGDSEAANVADEAQVGKEEVKKEKPIQHNKERCWACNKSIGLLQFSCRCGYVFCSQHRYVDSHECDFNYKEFERNQIRKQNQAVIADKVPEI